MPDKINIGNEYFFNYSDYKFKIENNSIAKNILLSNNSDAINNYLKDNKTRYSDKVYNCLKAHADISAEINKIRKNREHNKKTPEKESNLIVDGEKYMLNQKAERNQTSTCGCWSTTISAMLKSRGLSVPQEMIRKWRDSVSQNENDNPDFSKEPNHSTDVINNYIKDTEVDIADRADLICDFLPNTSLHTKTFTFDNEQSIANKKEKDEKYAVDAKLLENYILETVRDGIGKSLSPLGMNFGGHTRTVYGVDLEKRTLFINDPASNPKGTVEEIPVSKLVDYFATKNKEARTESVQFSWVEDIKTNEAGEAVSDDLGVEGIKYDKEGNLKAEIKGEGVFPDDSDYNKSTNKYIKTHIQKNGIRVSESIALPKRLSKTKEYKPVDVAEIEGNNEIVNESFGFKRILESKSNLRDNVFNSMPENVVEQNDFVFDINNNQNDNIKDKPEYVDINKAIKLEQNNVNKDNNKADDYKPIPMDDPTDDVLSFKSDNDNQIKTELFFKGGTKSLTKENGLIQDSKDIDKRTLEERIKDLPEHLKNSIENIKENKTEKNVADKETLDFSGYREHLKTVLKGMPNNDLKKFLFNEVYAPLVEIAESNKSNSIPKNDFVEIMKNGKGEIDKLFNENLEDFIKDNDTVKSLKSADEFLSLYTLAKQGKKYDSPESKVFMFASRMVIEEHYSDNSSALVRKDLKEKRNNLLKKDEFRDYYTNNIKNDSKKAYEYSDDEIEAAAKAVNPAEVKKEVKIELETPSNNNNLLNMH